MTVSPDDESFGNVPTKRDKMYAFPAKQTPSEPKSCFHTEKILLKFNNELKNAMEMGADLAKTLCALGLGTSFSNPLER